MPIPFNPLDQFTEITRSFAYKLNIGNYSSVDFFCSQKAQVPLAQAEAMSEAVYGFCKSEVLKSMKAFRKEMAESLESGEMPDIETRPFAERAREIAEEQNPFKVTADPPSTVPPNSNAAFQEQGRKNTDAEKAQTSRSASPGITGASPSPTPVGGDQPAPEPPAETPKSRGRGRAPAKESEQSKVVEMPPAGFRATDDDLPEVLTKPKALPQLERICIVIDGLAKAPRTDPAWTATKDKVQRFMRAFLNVPKLPGRPQSTLDEPVSEPYARVIPVLESMGVLYDGKLRADPEKAGLESGAGYGKLVRHIDKWPDDLKGSALDAAIAVYPDSPYDLVEFIETKPPIEGDANLMVFLAIMKRSREIAVKVRMFATANTMEMADIMVGLNLATCTEGEILGRLTVGLSRLDKPQEGLWE